jgi:hypothetical protein
MDTVTLRVDGREVVVASGSTLLEAANTAAIEIPTMCHRPGLAPRASCMVCVIEDATSGRLLPACSTRAQQGMEVITCSETVRVARRTALELLLGEHHGDCEGPCRQICPAGVDIPAVMYRVEAGDLSGALMTIKQSLALPAALSRICTAPCERGCRRGRLDQPLAIAAIIRQAADADLESGSPWVPPAKPKSGRKVAVVGSGPTGLAAAYYLFLNGHECTIFDDNSQPGGMLRHGKMQTLIPEEVLSSEIAAIMTMGIELVLGVRIGRELRWQDLSRSHDAVILATSGHNRDLLSALSAELGESDVVTAGGQYQTSIPGVFIGGDTRRSAQGAVKGAAHGRNLATAVDHSLRGVAVTGMKRRFASHIGSQLELDLGMHAVEERIESDPMREARRCLHCECLEADTCTLRQLADSHGADQRRFRDSTRRAIRKEAHREGVVYESGKCIRCGLCVRLTEAREEPLGLTYCGRGHSIEIGVPGGGSLDCGLATTALECAEICPTGALALVRQDSHR